MIPKTILCCGAPALFHSSSVHGACGASKERVPTCFWRLGWKSTRIFTSFTSVVAGDGWPVCGGTLEKLNRLSGWLSLFSSRQDIVGHETPKVLEGKNMLDLQARRMLWDNITSVNLFVMAFSLNIWTGFSTHTHRESILQNLRGKADLPYFQDCKNMWLYSRQTPRAFHIFSPGLVREKLKNSRGCVHRLLKFSI